MGAICKCLFIFFKNTQTEMTVAAVSLTACKPVCIFQVQANNMFEFVDFMLRFCQVNVKACFFMSLQELSSYQEGVEFMSRVPTKNNLLRLK